MKDLDGTTLDGRRVRVEHTRDSGLATDRRDRDGWRGGISSFGRGRVSLTLPSQLFFFCSSNPPLQPPGPRTGYRLLVENLSSGTSWQVRPPLLLIQD